MSVDRDVPRLLASEAAGWAEAERLRGAVEAALRECYKMRRGIGYRVSGRHETWDEYHEGMCDFAGSIERILDPGGSFGDALAALGNPEGEA